MTNTLNWNSIINHTIVPGHGNRYISMVNNDSFITEDLYQTEQIFNKIDLTGQDLKIRRI